MIRLAEANLGRGGIRHVHMSPTPLPVKYLHVQYTVDALGAEPYSLVPSRLA